MLRHVPVLVMLLTLSLAPAAGAQDGSPVAAAPTAMRAMFAQVPATLPGLEDPERVFIAYADIAAQLDALGITPPESVDDDGFDRWQVATAGLPLPDPAWSFVSWWRADYGFDLLQVDQTFWIAQREYQLALYRGDSDQHAVFEALRTLGYEPLEDGNPRIISIRGDYEYDLSAQTVYALASMNYAAALADGTLAFASAQAPLEAVLEVEAGQQPSLAERSDVAPLLAQAPDGLASALFVHGSLLAGMSSASIDASPGATPHVGAIGTEIVGQYQLPPVAMALLGTTVGGPIVLPGDARPPVTDHPDARAVVLLLMHSSDAAERAAPVVAERLATLSSAETNVPFAEYFPERMVRAVEGTPVVLVELGFGEEARPGILEQMLLYGDLGFLAW